MIELPDTEYWIRLRERAGFLPEERGRTRCGVWAERALHSLKKDHPMIPFRIMKTTVDDYAPLGLEFKLTGHLYLLAVVEQSRFVADGTAGQIDGDCPLGFYGFEKESKGPLRTIYRRGKEVSIADPWAVGNALWSVDC